MDYTNQSASMANCCIKKFLEIFQEMLILHVLTTPSATCTYSLREFRIDERRRFGSI